MSLHGSYILTKAVQVQQQPVLHTSQNKPNMGSKTVKVLNSKNSNISRSLLSNTEQKKPKSLENRTSFAVKFSNFIASIFSKTFNLVFKKPDRAQEITEQVKNSGKHRSELTINIKDQGEFKISYFGDHAIITAKLNEGIEGIYSVKVPGKNVYDIISNTLLENKFVEKVTARVIF